MSIRRAVPVVALLALGCGKTEAPAEAASAAQKPADEPKVAAAGGADAKKAAATALEKAPLAGKQSPLIAHEVRDITGKKVSLADYRGKEVMIVNTASQCGFTPQYAKLQELYGKYKDKGFEVLAFPSNDFGGQEPGSPDEIAKFVDSKFGVDFQMFDKVHAKGPEIDPLYRTLTEETPDGIRGEVKWNFTKFIVDPEGKVVARFNTKVDPMAPEVIEAVEKHLPAAG